MISFQTKVLDLLETNAKKNGCEIIQQASGSNFGRLVVQKKNPAFKTVATAVVVDYHFQTGHNKIDFNGHPGGPTDMTWLFAEHEDDKINALVIKFNRLVTEGLRNGLQMHERSSA